MLYGGLAGIRLSNLTIVQFIMLPFPFISIVSRVYTNISKHTQKEDRLEAKVTTAPGLVKTMYRTVSMTQCLKTICCGRG